MNKLKAIFQILFSDYFFVVSQKKDMLNYRGYYNTDFMLNAQVFIDEEIEDLIDMDDAANVAQQIIDHPN